jgi:hypothetical protein
MPDISEYYSAGKSLKAEDIDDEMTVVIESWRKQTFDDGKESYFLRLKDMEKEFRVNRTNAKRIAQMYGTEINDWVGQKISLMPDKTDYQGKMVDTIIVRVRKTKTGKINPGKYDERNPPPHDDMDDGGVPF